MIHSFQASSDIDMGYHYFAIITASFTFLLIVVGALVTGNDAGLSVPDWPLSYGSLNPPWVGNIRYEHGHRLVAAFVGFLTIVLAVWIWKKDSRQFVRRLGLLSLSVVITQGILGGVTVLWYLPASISILHACLAQTFFCLIVSLAWLSAPKRKSSPVKKIEQSRQNRQPLILSILITGTIYIQLVVGAVFRHTQSGIVVHVFGALVAITLMTWLVNVVFKGKYFNLIRPVKLMGVLVLVQVFLGIGSLVLRLINTNAVQPEFSLVVISTAHVALGALVLANSVIIIFESYRIIPIQYQVSPQLGVKTV